MVHFNKSKSFCSEFVLHGGQLNCVLLIPFNFLNYLPHVLFCQHKARLTFQKQQISVFDLFCCIYLLTIMIVNEFELVAVQKVTIALFKQGFHVLLVKVFSFDSDALCDDWPMSKTRFRDNYKKQVQNFVRLFLFLWQQIRLGIISHVCT